MPPNLTPPHPAKTFAKVSRNIFPFQNVLHLFLFFRRKKNYFGYGHGVCPPPPFTDQSVTYRFFYAFPLGKSHIKNWYGPLSHQCREGKTLVVRPIKKKLFLCVSSQGAGKRSILNYVILSCAYPIVQHSSRICIIMEYPNNLSFQLQKFTYFINKAMLQF